MRPGQLKGWARHEVKVDRYSLVVGELLMLLHDGRPDSPTHGVTQRSRPLPARASARSGSRSGSGTCSINLGNDEAHFVNFPTEPYHHDAPDRILLPWDTDELPVDVRSYLPKF